MKEQTERTNTMNMDEAREARIELENTIKNAVTEFHRQTGARVDSIDLTRYEIRDCQNMPFSPADYEISVKAEL